MRLALVLAFAVAAVATSRPASATPSKALEQARAEFRAGAWERTIILLYPLLSPPSLASADELTEAQIMMGVSFFETDDRERAAQWFEEALFIDDDIELDRALYSLEVVRFFDRTKSTLRVKLAEASERARLAREREAYRRALENALEVERHVYYVNFVPFGAGQFQNGQRKKGTAFAISQATLGGGSLLLFAIQWFAWGIPLEIPERDLGLAANVQRAQVASGVLFFALYGWSIVDALVYYQPTVTRRLDPRHIPPELGRPPGAGVGRSLRLRPAAGPDGASLTLSWEF